MMTFPDAIKHAFQNWSDFQGRASRSEYWWFFLFTVLLGIVTGVLDSIIFGSGSLGILGLIGTLAILVPGLSLWFRRLHDVDKSAWWTLIALIPLIGILALLFFATQPGSEGSNRFGAPPAA